MDNPQYTITVSGSLTALARVIAMLQSDATGTPVAMQTPQGIPGPMPTPGDDDGDNEPNAAAPNFDSAGFPHDERIHAKSKAQVADGTWRKRRNVQDALVTQVEAELRSKGYGQAQPAPQPQPMPAPQPQYAPQPQVMQPQPMPAPQPQYAPQPMPQPVPQPQYAPQPQVMQPAPQPMPAPQPVPQPQPVAPANTAQPAGGVANAPNNASGGMDIAQFMGIVAAGTNQRDASGAPLVTAEYIAAITNELSTTFNIPLSNITEIAPYQNVIMYALQLLQRDGKYTPQG